MTFCSRTIASADASVANATAANAVSGIRQDLTRMLSSSLGSAIVSNHGTGRRAGGPGWAAVERYDPVATMRGPTLPYSIGLDSDTLVEIASAEEASDRLSRDRNGVIDDEGRLA